MIGTRIEKILGDVIARRGRTFLVVMAIFLGVAGTIGMFSMRDIVLKQLREDIREDELAMITVNVAADQTAALNNDQLIDSLRSQPDVTGAVGYLNTQISFALNPEADALTEGFIEAFSTPFDARTIEPVRLYQGRYPAANSEIAIERRMASKYKLTVGDVLYVQVLSPDDSGETGTLHPFAITGVVFDPYIHPIGQEGMGEVMVEPSESIYSSLVDANWITGINGFTGIYGRFTDTSAAEDGKSAFINYIADQTPYIVNQAEVEDPADNQYVTTAVAIGDTLRLLALVSLLVCGFLVTNVINSIVVEQKRQIGILKSMGGSRRDAFLIYGGLAFVYGVLGVIPGVIVGIPAGYWAAQQISTQLSVIIEGFQVSVFGVAVGIVMGLLVPVFAALYPVWRGSRVSVLEAITDVGIDADYGSSIIARTLAILPLPIVLRQGLSNVSMKKGRLMFTVLTLTMAVGVSMGIQGLFSRVTNGVSSISDTATFDALVIPGDQLTPDEMVTLLANLPVDQNLIQAVEPGVLAFLEIDGYESEGMMEEGDGVQASGYDVTSSTAPFDFKLVSGEVLTADNASNGVMLSELLSINTGKRVGDTLTVTIFGESTDLIVVGIVDYPMDEMWLDWHTLASLVGHTQGAPIPNQYAIPVTLTGQSEPLLAVGIDESTEDALQIVAGEFPAAGEAGIIINEALTAAGGYTVGDTVLMADAETPDSVSEYVVAAVVSLPPEIADELPKQVLALHWRELAVLDGIDLGGEPIPQVFYLTTTLNTPTITEVNDVIATLEPVFNQQGIPVFMSNYVEQTAATIDMYNLFQLILQAVTVLIALVGALGLLSTLSMSVFERQREIGVMRSVGARSITIATQFLTEGFSVGVIAWLVGIPLAMGVYAVLLDVTGFSSTITAGLPVTSIGFGFAAVFAVVLFASLYPSISAARRTVADIIRYQ